MQMRKTEKMASREMSRGRCVSVDAPGKGVAGDDAAPAAVAAEVEGGGKEEEEVDRTVAVTVDCSHAE